MKRIGILLEFNYEDLEVRPLYVRALSPTRELAEQLRKEIRYNRLMSSVWYPLLRFKEEGMETFTIAPEAGKTYTSKKGYPCKSDRDIADVKLEDLDALIIPGGWAPDYWRRDSRFVDLVKNTFEVGKPVAAICHGAWMLCSAHVLTGKKVTCFQDDVINAGGSYEDAAVVVDGNLITSRVPSDLPQFCQAILKQLTK